MSLSTILLFVHGLMDCSSFRLYMKAAKVGYAIAQSNVAVEYSTGTGAVAQNLPVGKTKCWRKAGA